MTGSTIRARARLGACGIVAAFALAMVAALAAFSTPAQAAESSTVTANVYVNAQMANGFLLNPQMVAVSSTEAEGFGYADDVDSAASVSELDVLVKMQELTFGDAFTKDDASDYLVVNGGWISKAFGEESSNWGIALNNAAAVDENSDYSTSYGYSKQLPPSQAAVKTGDSVLVFYYDYIANDYSDATGLSYFESDGADSISVSATTGKPLTLSIKELPNFMGNGAKNAKDRAVVSKALNGIQLKMVNTATGDQEDISGAVTDSKGNATISFGAPGTYLVVAQLDPDAHATNPYVFVTVKNAAPSTTPVTPATKKQAVKITKGYTATVSGAKYQVTSASKKTVTYVKAPKGKKTVKVPATVKLKDGKTYKVTKIAAKAFKSNKTITKVVVGKNVAKIAKSAFYKTPKLHTVQVASKHLKKASTVKSSFKGSKLGKSLKVTTAKGVAKKYVKKSFTKKNLAAPKNVRVA